MKRIETWVLGTLVGVSLCLFVGLGGYFAYDLALKRGLLAGSAAAAATARPAAPTTLTRAPAAAAPTRAPAPTNTLVVPREWVNNEVLQRIQSKMVALRGLSPRQPVALRFLTVDDLRGHLAELYSRDNPGRKVMIQQQLYTVLGFLRESDDLNRLLRDLNARSISGFYSSEEQQLYIVSDRWNMSAGEEVAFAHEFTHAMQDQFYHLKSLDDRAATIDARLAMTALIEGDATLAMAQYAMSTLSQSDVNEIVYQAAKIDPNRINDVPRALARMTLFPYESGLRFAQALYKLKGWDALNAAFAVPPLSTEQIMHIEKYLTQPDAPRPVALPAMDDLMGGSWNEIDRGTLGEFLLGLHLQQGLSEQEALVGATGWGGDTYSLLTDAQGRRLWVLRSVWDAPTDAQRFFGAYAKLASAGGRIGRQIDEPGRALWPWPDREIYLSQHGSDTLVIIAPDAATLDRARHWFPGY